MSGDRASSGGSSLVTERHSSFRASINLAAFLLMVVVLLPLYVLSYPLGRHTQRIFAKAFFKYCNILVGLKVKRSGAKPNGRGTLYVANHASYLDIPVLGALTNGQFVAKSEVRGWPVFGFLAAIARTIFVSRQTSRIPQERLEIASRLARGESIFIFPEGSSSDGTGVLPFRPGLLSAVHADPDLVIPVQPVSVTYGPESKKKPVQPKEVRDQYAWYGDMELAPHLWYLFGISRKIRVNVHFHEPRPATEFENPRDLAIWAEHAVAKDMAQRLPGIGKAPRDPEEQVKPLQLVVENDEDPKKLKGLRKMN
ncbi:lysophospholipid acyltransferase family protein [Aestuariispira insulae]|uniref:Lyso-ornithine lipid acyltransferase n=1 Tax=Aestuariispira insulae TaxID=1461337 RepID=A0A3D9H403_9PROT|nr:lysophospholipid acyltransferase family protein [Aestuariispira insulae]RED44208.1 lyso-ornithine lipid acyltransferase [Aestuariispira insulae]